jgi:5'-nucleotidase
MLILLTNDDGIHAPGLAAMRRELVTLGEIHVVAPEAHQSAAAHGITVATPLLTTRVRMQDGFEGIAVDGRPADCVKLAISQLLPRTPDLVISGINAGANMGINVIYSGTVAAAIEGAFLGVPSIAVSLDWKGGVAVDFDRAARLARDMIEQVLQTGLHQGRVVSINLPALSAEESPTGVKVVRQCIRPWVDTYERRKNPRGREYFWNVSSFPNEAEHDTDRAALRDRYITITPLQFDMTHYPMLREWEHQEWRVPKSAAEG